MGAVKLFITLAVFTMSVSEIRSSSDTMKSIATGFLKVLDECKHDLGLTDKIVRELYQYWKLDYSSLTRDTGCVIICMSKKLDLIDSNGKLHHGNAQEFAVKHGAADDVASKIVVIIHECEKTHEGEGDDCLRVLEVAKCFRTGIHELNWSPKMDVIVSEVLTEI